MQPVALPIASLWRRALALLVDSCVYVVVAAIPLAIIWFATGDDFDFETGLFAPIDEDATTGEILATARDYAVLQLTWILYAGFLTSRASDTWNGRTVGKRAAGLRITSADGAPLSARAAWTRAVWDGLLLGGFGTLGAVLDAAIGTPPDGSVIAAYVGTALCAITVLPVLRGDRRQTLYDRWARTVVVDEPAPAAPQVAFVRPGAPAVAQSAPEAIAQPGTPVFEQPASAVSTDGSWDRTGPVDVVPRLRTWKTWAAAITGVLVLGISAVGSLALDDLAETSERGKRILALPETKAALAKLRTLEDLGEQCLKTGRAPDRCDEADELGATDMDFTLVFDLVTEPVGANAGKVGAVVEGDDVIFYAFTSADRTWSTTAGGGWLDRVCIERDGDLCKDVPSW